MLLLMGIAWFGVAAMWTPYALAEIIRFNGVCRLPLESAAVRYEYS